MDTPGSFCLSPVVDLCEHDSAWSMVRRKATEAVLVISPLILFMFLLRSEGDIVRKSQDIERPITLYTKWRWSRTYQHWWFWEIVSVSQYTQALIVVGEEAVRIVIHVKDILHHGASKLIIQTVYSDFVNIAILIHSQTDRTSRSVDLI